MSYYTPDQVKAGVELALKKFKGQSLPALKYIRNFDKQLYKELNSGGLLKQYFPPDVVIASKRKPSVLARMGRTRPSIGLPEQLRVFRKAIRKLLVTILGEQAFMDIGPLTEEVIHRHGIPFGKEEMKLARKSVNSLIWNMLQASGTQPSVLHGKLVSSKKSKDGKEHWSNIHLAKHCKNPRCVTDAYETSSTILIRRVGTPSNLGFITGLNTACSYRGYPPPEFIFKKIIEGEHYRASCLVRVALSSVSFLEGFSEITLNGRDRNDDEEASADVKKRLKEKACKQAFERLHTTIKTAPKVETVSL